MGSGPWDRYSVENPSTGGPWEKYGSSPTTPTSPTSSLGPPATQPKPAGPLPPGVGSISAYKPDVWDRLRSAFPIVDRIKEGLSGPASTNLEALAKPSPGMQTESAIEPQNLMTRTEQQQHPIATGAGEFASGMTTPQNALLMGMTAGAAPPVIARPLGALFSAQMLRGAYQELPSLRNAVQNKDWNEVERIGTHVVLGGTMGALGFRQTVEGVPMYEQFRQDGKTFSSIKNLANTRSNIETNGVGLFNRVRDALITHKEALEKQGGDAIQQAIEADNSSQLVKGRGNISTSAAVTEASNVIADTKYDMTPSERKAFNAMAGKSELTLQDAKLLRTQFGRLAFGRNSSPEFSSIGRAAYDELGEAMKGRLGELYGAEQGNRLFDYYNNRFQMSFGLEKKGGVAEPILSGIQNQDANSSIPALKDFAKGNVKEIQQQMRDTGNSQLADVLSKSQKDAKALTAAHDTVSGKFISGFYRMLQQYPKQAWPGLIAMAAVHGAAPYPLPMLAGIGVAGANILRTGIESAGMVGDRLQAELPPEKFKTRTEAMPEEKFTPKDPEQGWAGPNTPSSGSPQSEKARKIAAARKSGK